MILRRKGGVIIAIAAAAALKEGHTFEMYGSNFIHVKSKSILEDGICLTNAYKDKPEIPDQV